MDTYNNEAYFADDQIAMLAHQSQQSRERNGNFSHVPISGNIRPNKIYIGNLHYSLDTEKLKEAFSSYGEIVDAVVIRDKESGASRGFGFVTFSAAHSAREALGMHGYEIEGRKMRVKMAEAKPQQTLNAFALDSNL